MPLYEFQSGDGAVIERDLTREQLMDLPLEGGRLVLREGGKKYARVKPSIGGIVPHLEYDHDQYPKVSVAAPRFSGKSLGLDHVNEPGSKHHGKVIFNSARQQRDYCRANGYTRDYDPD